jgi:nucleotide-binding universal stress UspA family protein
MTDEQQDETKTGAEELEVAIRRILVALDTSTSSLAALQAAVGLASALQAELIGLFVEDVNLMRLAGLPFAQELRWPAARRQGLNEGQMEQQLRLRAAQARRALAMAADQMEVTWTFRVVRGQVTQEVLQACLEADLLSLGRTGLMTLRRSRMGSTAREAAARSPKPVLLAQETSEMEWPVVVTYDGSVLARRGLAAGARLAQRYGNNLIVLLLGESRESAAPLAAAAQEQIGLAPLHTDFRYVQLGNSEDLVARLRQESCSLVILAGETPPLQGDALQALLDALECPVMVVR